VTATYAQPASAAEARDPEPWLHARLAELGDFRTTKRYRAYDDGCLYGVEATGLEAPVGF
jgi:hypothetical protein